MAKVRLELENEITAMENELNQVNPDDERLEFHVRKIMYLESML